MRRAFPALAALVCAAGLAPPPAAAYPTGFVDELVASVPGAPVGFVCSPAGRYFVGAAAAPPAQPPKPYVQGQRRRASSPILRRKLTRSSD